MLDDDALSIGIRVAGSVINQVSLHLQVLVSQHPKIRGWLDKKLKDEALVICARRGALYPRVKLDPHDPRPLYRAN